MQITINKQLILEASSKDWENVSCDGVKQKLGFSCGRDKQGYFVYTHRAGSKRYPSLDKIPMKDLKFIDSTG